MDEEKFLTQIYAASMKPAKYMTATVRDDFLQDTPFEEIYGEIDTYNKLSLNENGKCYVATDVEAWRSHFLDEEPQKILDGVCVKTKVNRYSDEPILVDISTEYNNKTDEEELKIEVIRGGFYFSDDKIINTEFEERVRELDGGEGWIAASIYYIGNVAYLLLFNYKLKFERYEVEDIRGAREYMKKQAKIINDYIDLANLLK